MIVTLRGQVTHLAQDWIIVENQGLGYQVYFARPEEVSLNQTVFLYTYHHIREDDQSLYGFLTRDDFDLFIRFISVKGVGCKTANTIFTAAKSSQLIQAIEMADLNFLKKMPGIGAKTAQQIILDLKGKLVNESTEKKQTSLAYTETLEALKHLGYKASELSFLSSLASQHSDVNSESLLKLALIQLNARKGK